MKDTSQSPLDSHLARIARGGKFFRSCSSLALLVAVAVVAEGVFELLPIVQAQDGADRVWASMSILSVAFIRALWFLLLALALRHIDNLFKAVHGAIDDLRTTV